MHRSAGSKEFVIKTPNRIRALKQSQRALKLGLWSLIPVAGYPMAFENFRIFKSLLKEKEEDFGLATTLWVVLGFTACHMGDVFFLRYFPDYKLMMLTFVFIGFVFLNELFVLNRMAWNPCRLQCYLGVYLSACSISFFFVTLAAMVAIAFIGLVNM